LHSLEKGLDTSSSATGCHNHLRCIASSSPPTNSLFTQNLCLSLDWEYHDETSEFCGPPTSNQIVSSYSSGQLAIHTARWGSLPTSTTVSFSSESGGVEALTEGLLEETVRFDAHTLFGEPSEVWTCCWCRCTSSRTTILSGADDCNLKGWDTRVSTQIPIFCINEHEAGVTALSWHPREQYIFASGSYDEGVRIWDIRSVSSNKSQPQKPVAKLPSCGGGVWRLKWHPLDSDKLLVAAMHGGCHILHVHALDSNEDQRCLQSNQKEDHIQITSSFTEHKSMAYGADWFPVTYCTNDGAKLRYLAVSCSFYDQQAFLWDPCSCSYNTGQLET
jgi:diphthamide biosynthesis protein 7